MVDHGVVAGTAPPTHQPAVSDAIAVVTPGATLDVRQSPAAVPQLVAA